MTYQKIIALLNDFTSYFQLRDVADILIVALIIYLIIAFVRQSKSYFIFYALLFLFGVNYLARVLNLSLTRQIFQPLLTFVLLFFVVVFQREIRRFFEWFSAHGRRLTMQRKISLTSDSAKTIAETVFEMAEKRIGAIIVFQDDYPLDQLVEGGFSLDGRISRPLLLSVFDTSSPGHDGAVIIDNNRIKKFGVHLPLAERFNKFASVGTRHRATAGITQKTDAAAIVISEERGEVSWSERGELMKILESGLLEEKISRFLKESLDLNAASGWRFWLIRNWPTKLLSLFLAFVLWSVFVYQIGVTSQDFTVPVEFRYLPKELTMEKILPATVDITLSGNYRDLHTLEDKDLKVFVDMKDVKEGWQKIDLSENNLIYPPYLNLVSTEPRVIKFNVIKNESPAALPVNLPLDNI